MDKQLQAQLRQQTKYKRSEEVEKDHPDYEILVARENVTRDFLQYYFGVRYFGKYAQGLEKLNSLKPNIIYPFTGLELAIVEDVLLTVEAKARGQHSMLMREIGSRGEAHDKVTHHNPNR